MKTKEHKTTLTSKLICILLLLVFMAMPLVQFFHYHHENSSTSHCSSQKKVTTYTAKCEVCDYLVHKKSKDWHSFTPFVVVKLPTKMVTLLLFKKCGLYNTSLFSFTNKGPPQLV